MLDTSKCLFCSLHISPDKHTNPEDYIFEKSSLFYAKPALGHFIEGYTLIVSNEHYKNFASMSDENLRELNLFKEFVARKLKSIYDTPIIAFEHGDVAPSHRAGSCIDHAHIHLIPFNFDIHGSLKKKFSFEILSSLDELSKHRAQNSSYIYYESCNNEKYLFRVDSSLTSQYLRKQMCMILKKSDEWDWAIFPFREKIIAFLDRYNSRLENFSSKLENSTLRLI